MFYFCSSSKLDVEVVGGGGGILPEVATSPEPELDSEVATSLEPKPDSEVDASLTR